ncbi:TPA: hypothetical protein ACH3X1_015835 [Trebouxia sp. C0004]
MYGGREAARGYCVSCTSRMQSCCGAVCILCCMATSYIEAHAIQLSNTGAYSGRVTSWQSTGVSWVFSHSSSVWLPFAEFKAMAVLCTLAERFATAVAMIAHGENCALGSSL